MKKLNFESEIIWEKAYVLCVVKEYEQNSKEQRDASRRSISYALEESLGLAKAFCLQVVDSGICPLRKENPHFCLGKGWAEKIQDLVKSLEIGIVVVNCHLSSVQQKNLEKFWECKVLDRVGLILGIFGLRARSAEGKLQVHLAQLNYQKSRLAGFWSHLERQRSGGGFLGGPGEKQKELDRRMLSGKISVIEEKLEKVHKTRTLQRTKRKKNAFPLVGLVGYTNAGKSTLFNQLTRSEVLAEDALFATLDTKMKGLKLPSGRSVILSDTVGFIADLPTLLVAAFHSTLEEVLQAEILLHVQDVSHPQWRQRKEEVIKVLKEIGFSAWDRLVDVYNKADLLDKDQELFLFHDIEEKSISNSVKSPNTIYQSPEKEGEFLKEKPLLKKDDVGQKPLLISALSNESSQGVLRYLDDYLSHYDYYVHLSVPLTEGKIIAWCHEKGIITQEDYTKESASFKMFLSPIFYKELQEKEFSGSLKLLKKPLESLQNQDLDLTRNWTV